jgi:hypothetical protein
MERPVMASGSVPSRRARMADAIASIVHSGAGFMPASPQLSGDAVDSL